MSVDIPEDNSQENVPNANTKADRAFVQRLINAGGDAWVRRSDESFQIGKAVKWAEEDDTIVVVTFTDKTSGRLVYKDVPWRDFAAWQRQAHESK